jgi:hypothetical protein
MKQIIITVKPDGNLDVTGPLNEKLLCYGMLELAKEIIGNYKPGAIITPSPSQINGELKNIDKN